MDQKLTDQQRTIRELLRFTAGELICFGLICGGFALAGRLDGKVLLGAGVGAVLAILNYVLMAVGVYAAANKAERGDAKGAQGLMTLSMMGRYALLIVTLVLFAKSGLCNLLAMVIPLIMARVLVFLGEFFRKKEER